MSADCPISETRVFIEGFVGSFATAALAAASVTLDEDENVSAKDWRTQSHVDKPG